MQPADKPCKNCGAAMPASANFCNACKLHQDFVRRNLSIGSTSLALLVALFAVLGSALPPVLNLIRPPNSQMQAVGVTATAGRVQFVASNAGERPGAVRAINIMFNAQGDRSLPGTLSFLLPEGSVLAPGEMRSFVLTLAEHATNENPEPTQAAQLGEYQRQLELWAADGTPTQQPPCRVEVDFYGFRGDQVVNDNTMPCWETWVALYPRYRQAFDAAYEAAESIRKAAEQPAIP